MIENWRPIDGTDGMYEVSDQGRVRSLDRTITTSSGVTKRRTGVVLVPFTGDAYGHQSVGLGSFGRRYVHQLVLEAFAGPCPRGLECRHLDGDAANNALSNLQWGTASENQRDRIAHGTHHWARRTHCEHGHEFTPENTYVRVRTGPRYVGSSESRVCRTCKRIQNRESKRRRRAQELAT